MFFLPIHEPPPLSVDVPVAVFFPFSVISWGFPRLTVRVVSSGRLGLLPQCRMAPPFHDVLFFFWVQTPPVIAFNKQFFCSYVPFCEASLFFFSCPAGLWLFSSLSGGVFFFESPSFGGPLPFFPPRTPKLSPPSHGRARNLFPFFSPRFCLNRVRKRHSWRKFFPPAQVCFTRCYVLAGGYWNTAVTMSFSAPELVLFPRLAKSCLFGRVRSPPPFLCACSVLCHRTPIFFKRSRARE